MAQAAGWGGSPLVPHTLGIKHTPTVSPFSPQFNSPSLALPALSAPSYPLIATRIRLQVASIYPPTAPARPSPCTLSVLPPPWSACIPPIHYKG